jgi:hypothetical protein
LKFRARQKNGDLKGELVGATDRTQYAAMGVGAAMRRLSASRRIETALAGGEYDHVAGSGLSVPRRLRSRANRDGLQDNQDGKKSTDEPQGFVLDAEARTSA